MLWCQCRRYSVLRVITTGVILLESTFKNSMFGKMVKKKERKTEKKTNTNNENKQPKENTQQQLVRKLALLDNLFRRTRSSYIIAQRRHRTGPISWCYD